MTDQIRAAKVTDFTQDDRNANQGTDRGRDMVQYSLEALGAGRSVLVDKNDVLIAGNKTQQAAIAAGLEDAIVVETDGTKLIIHKRIDLDLASDAKAKELAIADNRASEVGLAWDVDVLAEVDAEIDLAPWFTPEEQAEWVIPEKGATSRFTHGDDDDVPPISEGGIALAIVLSSAEYGEWQVMKETAGTASDKTAFLKLMRGEL